MSVYGGNEMKSLTELGDIKAKALEEAGLGGKRKFKRIVVGMATCGIAAGAKPVYEAIKEELSSRGIKDAKLVITGCIGVCRLEPIVEVYDEDGVRTTYVSMTAEKGRRVVAEHIVNNRACADLAISQAAEK
jgi:NADP-reducing hydrogenase subunit HndB